MGAGVPVIGRAGSAPGVPKGHRIPAQGNALGSVQGILRRSEGTPHIRQRRACDQSHPMRRSFRTPHVSLRYPGLHPGLVCTAPSGRRLSRHSCLALTSTDGGPIMRSFCLGLLRCPSPLCFVNPNRSISSLQKPWSFLCIEKANLDNTPEREHHHCLC